MATMIGCPSCWKSIPRDALSCPHCAHRMGDVIAPRATPVKAPPRWGRVVLFVGLIVLGIWLVTSESGPRGKFLAFDKQRDDWHRRCDIYIGKPAVSPAARACAQEIEELAAYAKRQGW